MSRPGTAKRVLLVDDDENSRCALAEALQKEGYEVIAVGNGLEALDHLKRGWRPACIVLDMRMPVKTGWELWKAMEGDTEMRQIPVIGMTGGRWKAEDEDKFASLIAKPIVFEDLLAALKRCGA